MATLDLFFRYRNETSTLVRFQFVTVEEMISRRFFRSSEAKTQYVMANSFLQKSTQ
jgi:hypothetical protein